MDAFPLPVLEVWITSVYAFRMLVKMTSVETRPEPCLCLDFHNDFICCRDIDSNGVIMSRSEMKCDIKRPKPTVIPLNIDSNLLSPLLTVCVSLEPLIDFLSKTPNTRLLRLTQKERGGVVLFEHEDPATSCLSTLELPDGLGGLPSPYNRGLPQLPRMTFDHLFRFTTKHIRHFLSQTRKNRHKAESFSFTVPPSKDSPVQIGLMGSTGVLYQEQVQRRFITDKDNQEKQERNYTVVMSLPIPYLQQFIKPLTNDTHFEVYLSEKNPIVLSINLGHSKTHSYVRHMIAPTCYTINTSNCY